MPERSHNILYLKDRRKYLRSHTTRAEAAMWNMLKGQKIEGVKFRRQHSIGHYILDFYAPQLKLCIELDGQPHFTVDGALNDDTRSQYLINAHNIYILRFENKTIFENPEGVVASIRYVILERRKALGVDA